MKEIFKRKMYILKPDKNKYSWFSLFTVVINTEFVNIESSALEEIQNKFSASLWPHFRQQIKT